MTRINVLPVEQLTDQHLLAEYRELPMVPQALRRTINSKNGFKVSDIPSEYTLGKGHVKFFYDKLGFLCNRYTELVNELLDRGYSLDLQRDDKLSGLPEWLYLDYTPTANAIAINQERIDERINQKPDFYTIYGRKLANNQGEM